MKDVSSEDTSESLTYQKQVQYPATRVAFHSSAPDLPREFGHRRLARLTVPPLPLLGKENEFLQHSRQK